MRIAPTRLQIISSTHDASRFRRFAIICRRIILAISSMSYVSIPASYGYIAQWNRQRIDYAITTKQNISYGTYYTHICLWSYMSMTRIGTVNSMSTPTGQNTTGSQPCLYLLSLVCIIWCKAGEKIKTQNNTLGIFNDHCIVFRTQNQIASNAPCSLTMMGNISLTVGQFCGSGAIHVEATNRSAINRK